MIGERLKKKFGGGRDNRNPRFRLIPYYRTCFDDRKKSDIDEIIIVLIHRGSVPIYIWSTTSIINGQ
jgi:hypothetical protein